MNHVKLACIAAGGQRRLGAAVDVSQQSVSKWVQNRRVPAHHCPMVALLTGIPCRLLNPDVFADDAGCQQEAHSDH